MDNQINIILNGKNVKGKPGETILQLAQRHNISIPTLCNDPRLDPFSSCFVCVVEVEGMRGLQPSCSTAISEGMIINTENTKVRKARKSALDLLLSNHYADCEAPCKNTCPAGVDVQGYISLIEKGLYSEAVKLIKQDNPLPAICGRVCVRPCEVACRRNLLDEGAAVGIDYMKRFAADRDLESETHYIPEIEAATGKKVAIIGGGPGGLSAAYWLQQRGHQCDIYEAAPKPGGWLRYGIPEYRLPNDLLDQEIETITELGVNIFCNKKLGDNISFKEIQEKYDSYILTIGSQRGTLIGCEGDDADNVFSGIDFLRNMEMTGQRYDFSGKKVAVVGGGNTAMDCCRTSIRCGADKVYVIYRRTEKEMPANPIEIHESKLEGVEYLFLTNPSKVNKDENGAVKSVTCLKMELGEPDASGRRRPVPVEGSEFDLEVNYILAAIGQKTDVNFIEDVNSSTKSGELKVNRWGDIDADKHTLQTGVPGMFAAGDGVSGPATIIEAVAQAKTAVRSCHQYLTGQEFSPEPFEFISRKDNFKTQVQDDYVGRFVRQTREEMPVLDAVDRFNFNEVELGYTSEEIAKKETSRCLECGCTEYFTCDLKNYATEYQVEQNKFEGEYKEYQVDFSHPYIEIDNNKCILCARCIRMCREVVGANALGLVNRGFDTYVAPSLGNSLTETDCESCGMCISTCPTGAITENVSFKPGPVELERIDTVDFFGSEGAEISLFHRGGFFMKADGREGEINKQGNIGRQAKFGYRVLNDERLIKPMIRKGEDFQEIEFEEAYKLIAERINSVNADENAFFAGARLSNEELYMVQKLARDVAKTNNIESFHYNGSTINYLGNETKNVPFEQLGGASKFFILGDNLNTDHHYVSYIINNTSFKNGVPLNLIHKNAKQNLLNKVAEQHSVESFYYFIKAVNHHLLENGLENGLFIKDHCEGFDAYKKELLSHSFAELLNKSGIRCNNCLQEWAEDFNKQQNAILLYSEKDIDAATAREIRNLMLITGKLGKTSSGVVALKQKNNSQGLLDMGIHPSLRIGGVKLDDANIDLPGKLNTGEFKNVFIFGEDPIGCALDDASKPNLMNTEFVVVSDYFMTDTAKQADLILPATFPFETGGSCTNTQKFLQQFEKAMPSKVKYDNIEQLAGILKEFGVNGIANAEDAFSEFITKLPQQQDKAKEVFETTEMKNETVMFRYGCDVVVKRFEEQYKKAFTGTN